MSPETATTSERRATAPIGVSEVEEKTLRKIARRRAGLCPGAGWALLGHPGRGLLALVSVAAMLVALAWLVITLSTASLWAAGVTTIVALAIWLAELFDVSWCMPRPTTESLLIRRYRFTTFVVWATGVAVVLLVPVWFGSLAIEYDRMAPTLEPGDRVIFHRGVPQSELARDTVVVFRLPLYSKAGTPGSLEVARILAVPGDKLTVQVPKGEQPTPAQRRKTRNKGRSNRKSSPRLGHYLVNGEVTRFQGPAGGDLAVTVPAHPKEIKVPDDCYFVVQDSEDTGVDSQQLEWIRRGDIVSTRLFQAGNLRPVR